MPACLPPIWAPNTHTLFLGTLPGETSLHEAQYYAHPRNQFWTILSALHGDAPIDYQERKYWLLALGYGLWDVLATAERTTSADAAIVNSVPNDFSKLAHTQPALKRIAFTSAQAHHYYERLVPVMPNPGWDMVILPSPSAAYAKLSLEQKTKIWRMYLTSPPVTK